MLNLDKTMKFNLWYLLIILITVPLLRDLWISQNQVKQIPYSEFQALLDEKRIDKIIIGQQDITGKIIDPEGKKKYIHTQRVENDLAKELAQYNVQFEKKVESTLFKDLLSWIFPFLVFFLLWKFVANKIMQNGGAQGGFMSVGKSKAKIYVESDTKVDFDCVAGVDEAKVELKELVDFLKNPLRYQNIGGRMPKGVLLVGPPGTGKTLIAKAVAGEANVPFFSTNGAEFVEMFVGVGAARVRDLFEQAKQRSPCIIFIDELDALGKVRMGGSMGHGNDEKEQTLNQLLVELDGFDSTSGIILLAATNRPEILDPALLRSGRFDRQVLVDRPDKIGRLEILKIHTKKIKLRASINLENIAALTPGFTGADLENIANEASLIAVRREASEVAENDFTEAIERIMAGLEKKNRLINPFERKVVAHHEMGHAIVGHILMPAGGIHKVSIIPRGIGSLGYTIQRPTEDRFLMTKTELINKMAVLLAGRVAEKIIFNHLSTGAADDLDKATEIAWNAVTKYGMDENIGDIVYDNERQTHLDMVNPLPPRMNSDKVAQEIDSAVRSFIKAARGKSENILDKNKAVLQKAAHNLLEKETLLTSDLQEIFTELII